MDMSRLNVLLIEDDEDDYILVRNMLSSIPASSYDLIWVAEYEPALAELDRDGYHVCLLDYRLGRDNGLELMREATRRGFNKPVIFLTGQGDYTIDLEAMRAGAADYLVKGQITAPLLERSIRYAIGRNRTEDALRRGNRTLRALSASGKSLIHASREADLLRDVCRIVVEAGGYRLAWIGFAEDGPKRRIRPVEWYGYEAGYLDAVGMSWTDDDMGSGPTGKAIRTGQPCMTRDVRTDPDFAPWREEALKRRYVSGLSLPLTEDGVPFGALNIYARESDAFDAEEVKLLKELADSLSYGIMSLKSRRSLEQHRLHLEDLVAKRTEELTEANRQLHSEIAERRLAEEEIRRAKEEWERTFNTVPDLISVLDNEHRIVRMNRAMADRLGIAPRDGEGLLCHESFHDLPLPLNGCPHSLALADGKEHTVEIYEERLNGHFLVTVTPLCDSEGNVVGATHIARDISRRKQMENALRKAHDELEVRVRERTAELATANEQLRLEIEERKRAEAALRESERFLKSSIDALSVNLAILDEDGAIILVNKAWKDFADANGFAGESHGVGTNYLRVCDAAEGLDSDGAPAIAEGIGDVLSRKTDEFHMEYTGLSPRGKRWFAVRITAFKGEGAVRAVVTHEDITERTLIEEQIRHDAFHDPLTGLPNRALFLDRLGLVAHRARRRKDYNFAVLFVDIDKFKLINDSHGHTIGDKLLISIAQRIRQCTRFSDTVARLGGDEFAILLDDIRDINEAVRFTERLQARLTEPFNLGGLEAFTSASIGIVLNEPGCDRPDDYLRDADIAMYRAKALGRGRHEVFDRDMRAQVVKRLQMETDLRKALEREEFRVYYQPIVSLETGRVDGLEALIRWMHPERGLVAPADFIPLAEETGLIIRIGYWVLRKACKQMHEWCAWLPESPPPSLSVNISPKQLRQSDLVEEIENIVRETGLDASSLKLEITESAVMESTEDTMEVLSRLKAIGIQLSIDDFGTGYSSLSHLHRFPVDTLKIDRSFVSSMNICGENYEIVRTIVSLARNLGLIVVAEGPELAEQVEQLRGLGCDQAQGFFFAQPLEESEAGELLRQQRAYSPAEAFQSSLPPSITCCLDRLEMGLSSM